MARTPLPRPFPRTPSPDVAEDASRRAFLRRCAAAAALAGLPDWFIQRELQAAGPGAPVASPNERPGIALIGCGGMGTGDALNALNFGNVVAICDVDEEQAAKARAKLVENGAAAPEVYSDFRRVLNRKDIQIVINGTPDHWHTPINVAAAKAGKDIYSEKPLTLTIDEGRRLATEVRRRRVVLQTGSQQRSSERFRLACELVRNGRIGKIRQVEVWLPAGLREGPFATSAVPATLNWDFWLGQAPKVDYVAERCHRNFRFWYAYSGGTLTDWGAHHNDIAYWALGQLAPRTVRAKRLAEPIAGGYDAISEYEIRYVYPDDVALTVRTTRADSIYGAVVDPAGQRNGIRFEGSDGWLWVDRSRINCSDPERLRTPLPDGAVRLYHSNNHMGNFFDCVRSRKDPICDVETGHRSATVCHLGAIALRTGLPLTWDSRKEHFVDAHAREGNRYVVREMRKPYDYRFYA
jgi:predicted dehydrogenase